MSSSSKPRKNTRKQPRKISRRTLFTASDIFAGGGGLTVGLKNAGFRVVSAVELDSEAYNTYRANHPDVKSYRQDVRSVVGADLVAAGERLMLLAGCPPCQGFSSLTSKYKKHDPRNDLVFEMGRLIRETLPAAVMMENVPGLARRGKPIFNEFLRELEELGYQVNWDILQVADYGIPQNRKRLVLLAGHGFSIPLPEQTHDQNGRDGLPQWLTLRDAIGHLKERPVTLSKANASGGPQSYNWHVIRNMTEANKARLKYARAGQSRKHIPQEFRPKCHTGDDKGFPNVYGKLSWAETPPTMTGGCTTLSKGRFGHPSQIRTLSVREAAEIQTFPSDYVIETPYMDYACDIIGNALPCRFAEIVSAHCLEAIKAARH